MAFQRPDLYDQQVVGRMFAEDNDVDASRVMAKEQVMPQIPGLEGIAGEGVPATASFNPEVSPLKSLINQTTGK